MKKLNYTTVEKLLFTVAQLHYEQGLTRTAIAGRMNISITHVSRLLREALKEGIVNISLRTPRHADLELSLCSRFGLREARVVSSGRNEADDRAHLGHEAAELFGRIVQSGSSVALGSGRTMYELVKAIPEAPIAIHIYPLAVIADRSSEVRSIDAATLVTTLWFKLRPEARALKIGFTFPAVRFSELEPLVKASLNDNLIHDYQRSLASADVFFFSCSQVRKESQILDITREQGLDRQGVRELGVTGDYLFRTLDRLGSKVDVGVDNYVVGADLQMLSKLAEAPHKTLVLVSGGKEKVEVIYAGLRGRLFNVLITDDATASLLVDKTD